MPIVTNTVCCVYIIKNLVDLKFYIGSTVNFERRIRYHRWELNNNRHHNNYLQNAWNKHGEQSFKFEILEIGDELSLRDLEQKYIDLLRPYIRDLGYNLCVSAAGTGTRHLEETKKRISKSNSGKKRTNETKDKISKSKTGKKAVGRCVATEEHWNAKTFLITNLKTGEEFLIKNLALFCRENDLDVGTLHETSKENSRRKQHKGYKCKIYI